MIKWFKKHKRLLLVVATLTCPSAVVYVQTADVIVEAAEVLTEQEKSQ